MPSCLHRHRRSSLCSHRRKRLCNRCHVFIIVASAIAIIIAIAIASGIDQVNFHAIAITISAAIAIAQHRHRHRPPSYTNTIAIVALSQRLHWCDNFAAATAIAMAISWLSSSSVHFAVIATSPLSIAAH
jgi:hypothetical protein